LENNYENCIRSLYAGLLRMHVAGADHAVSGDEDFLYFVRPVAGAAKECDMRILMAGIMLLWLATLSSCVSINETDPDSPLPSNRPAGWESTTLGVPI
jgi:hypothetical protein